MYFQAAFLSKAYALTFSRCGLPLNTIEPKHPLLMLVLATIVTQPQGCVSFHGRKPTQVTALKWGERLALFPSIRGFLNLATSAVLRLFS